MAAPLEVTLVFRHLEIRNDFLDGAIRGEIKNAVAKISQSQACPWNLQGCDTTTDTYNGGVQFWAKIQHHEFNANDDRAEDAISALCEYLFLESSVLALDSLLNGSKIVMGPLSETPMATTDSMFGRYFCLQLLKQLNVTDGIGFVAQNAVHRSGHFITRNPSKWFHAPLYAGLCVTNVFIFLDDPLRQISDQNVDEIAALYDEGLHDFFEKAKWLMRCAKVFASWAPQLNDKIETQIQKLDPAKKKESLQGTSIAIVSGGKMLETSTQKLGEQDPNESEFRQMYSTMTTMIKKYEPLNCAAGDYVDSCVSETVKNTVFATASLTTTCLGAAFIRRSPNWIGALGLGAVWLGYLTSSALTGYFGSATVAKGANLYRSRQLKPKIRLILISLISFRLFLFLMLFKTQECLDRNSSHYEELKQSIQSQFDSDLDRFAEPGYVNETIKTMARQIKASTQVLEDDIADL
ncbi:hypothetical protein HYFRA_00014107 [Hymenoscyphus fraxineus]|uniref:Uncharacterized protein n=1 Tax=Hymenoscyphus fraxineus TaxID=746836 RepID=A0A9N9PPH6_9HELO|nr:hypothetical protein HYFRA_00014107 [Hymenoscyphus fraxineus]